MSQASVIELWAQIALVLQSGWEAIPAWVVGVVALFLGVVIVCALLVAAVRQCVSWDREWRALSQQIAHLNATNEAYRMRRVGRTKRARAPNTPLAVAYGSSLSGMPSIPSRPAEKFHSANPCDTHIMTLIGKHNVGDVL